MKNKLFLFSCAALLALAGCTQTDDENTAQPILTSTTTEDIIIASDGGQYNISYYLENPAEKGTLSAAASQDCDWIDEFTYDTPGIISFTASANTTGQKREATIMVSYIWPGGEPQFFTVNTVQAAEGEIDPDPNDDPDLSDSGFNISLTDVTLSTVSVKIEPEDMTMPYIAFLSEMQEIEGLNDSDLFSEAVSTLDNIATTLGISIQDYITRYRLMTGTQTSTQSKLNPGTKYLIYVCGIDNTGDYPVRATVFSKKDFTTKTSEITENGITLDVEVIGKTLSAIATPYTDDRWYNVNWNRDNILNNAGFTDGTAAERVVAYEYQWMSEYMQAGWAIDYLAWKGPRTISTSMQVADTYYVFAYFITEQLELDSEVWIETIEFDGSTATIL